MSSNELIPAEVYVLDRAELCYLAYATNTPRVLYMDGGVGLLYVDVDMKAAQLQLERFGYGELAESTEHPLAKAFACLRNETSQVEVQVNESGQERRTYLFACDGDAAVSLSPSPLGAQMGFVIRCFSAEALNDGVLRCCDLDGRNLPGEADPDGRTLMISADRFIEVRNAASAGNGDAAVAELSAWAWPERSAADFVAALADRPTAYELRHVQKLDDGRLALDELSWFLASDGTGWTFTLDHEQHFGFRKTTTTLVNSDVISALSRIPQ